MNKRCGKCGTKISRRHRESSACPDVPLTDLERNRRQSLWRAGRNQQISRCGDAWLPAFAVYPSLI